MAPAPADEDGPVDGGVRVPVGAGGNDEIAKTALVQPPLWDHVDVRARFFEIYNERIIDLLLPAKLRGGRNKSPQNSSQTQSSLKIQVHPQLGIIIPGLTVDPAQSAADCFHLLEYGRTMQTIASTQMNTQSSRAHTVFALKICRNGGGWENRLPPLTDVYLR